MGLRAAAVATFPFALRVASSPGCGCHVSHCCGMLRSSELGQLFDSADLTLSSVIELTSGGDSPTCTFLNLVPGLNDASGLCATASGGSSPTVCDAIAASAPANSRLESGKSIVSLFLEQGTCAEAEGGACLESPPQSYAQHIWLSLRPGDHNCPGIIGKSTPALASSLSCSQGGNLTVRAAWVDPNATDFFTGRTFDPCKGDYSKGLDVGLGPQDWTAGSEGSPRWSCLDVPRGDMGTEDYRALVFSIGDLPCVATTTTEPADRTTASVDGAIRACLAAIPLAVAAAISLV